MNKLALSIGLTLAPFLALAYYYAAKILLSRTDAARHSGNGGTIAVSTLDIYYGALIGSALLGAACAFLLGSELAKLVNRGDS